MLTDEIEFKQAESNLYESGMTSSKQHAHRLIIEIRKRILVDKKNIPRLGDLIHIAKSNAGSLILGQILFVYLYFSDEFVAHITDKLGDIFIANLGKPDISRNEIKTLLIHYLQSKTVEPDKKTILNWIGKYLSIMREVNLLVRKKNNEYFLNFRGIQPETWIFFTLHAYFNNYGVADAEFLKAFQIKPVLLPKIIEQFSSVKSVIYKMVNDENDILDILVTTTYRKFNDWIADIK